MKSAKTSPSRWPDILFWVTLAAVAAILVIALSGCTSTLTPVQTRAKAPSLDGNAANSGYLGTLPDGTGILTFHAQERYRALANDYGYKFKPPVVGNECKPYTNSLTWTIDREHLAQFGIMTWWKKNGVK